MLRLFCCIHYCYLAYRHHSGLLGTDRKHGEIFPISAELKYLIFKFRFTKTTEHVLFNYGCGMNKDGVVLQRKTNFMI